MTGDWLAPPPSPLRPQAPGRHDEQRVGTSTWPPTGTSPGHHWGLFHGHGHRVGCSSCRPHQESRPRPSYRPHQESRPRPSYRLRRARRAGRTKSPGHARRTGAGRPPSVTTRPVYRPSAAVARGHMPGQRPGGDDGSGPAQLCPCSCPNRPVRAPVGASLRRVRPADLRRCVLDCGGRAVNRRARTQLAHRVSATYDPYI